jgi:hypothetical protein
VCASSRGVGSEVGSFVVQSQGALKLHSDGLIWKKTGGGKSVELTSKGERPPFVN